MDERPEPDVTTPRPDPERQKGLLDRHPKLAIIAIAGVFYAVLIGMCLAVLIIIWQG